MLWTGGLMSKKEGYTTLLYYHLKAEQSRAEQSRAEQSRADKVYPSYFFLITFFFPFSLKRKNFLFKGNKKKKAKQEKLTQFAYFIIMSVILAGFEPTLVNTKNL